MIRRFIEWLLRKKKADIDPIEALNSLLPVLYSVAIVMSFFRMLGPIHVSWYKKIRSRARISIRRLRHVVIGY